MFYVCISLSCIVGFALLDTLSFCGLWFCYSFLGFDHFVIAGDDKDRKWFVHMALSIVEGSTRGPTILFGTG